MSAHVGQWRSWATPCFVLSVMTSSADTKSRIMQVGLKKDPMMNIASRDGEMHSSWQYRNDVENERPSSKNFCARQVLEGKEDLDLI